MKPSKHLLLLATVAALGVALVCTNDPAMAEGLAAKKTADEAKDNKTRDQKWIEIQSMQFGGTQPKTGGQNEMQSNDVAGAQKKSAPMPSESMSLNYGKVKVDGRDYLLWRKNLSQQPAGGALPTGSTDLGAKDPKETPLIVPAVQAAREAARKSPNTQKDIKK
jgi:hypothetical protein